MLAHFVVALPNLYPVMEALIVHKFDGSLGVVSWCYFVAGKCSVLHLGFCVHLVLVAMVECVDIVEGVLDFVDFDSFDGFSET